MNGQAPASLADTPWLKTRASQRLMGLLTAGDLPARFVGGSVRDAILGRSDLTTDLDVATPLLPDQVIERLETDEIKVIPTGLSHGTVTAVIGRQTFEITTLRRDVACDGRHADVQFTDDFVLDAKRRDFTINAMSMDRKGRLFDYFEGWKDLEAGCIRFVGNAHDRVREDYLRILRYFRFFARFGRPPADPEALDACRNGRSGLQRLSGERIRAEMLKLLASEDPIPSLELMLESHVLPAVVPNAGPPDRLRRLIAVAPDSDPLLRLAALLLSTDNPAAASDAVAERWRLSRAEAARLAFLTQERPLALPTSASEVKRQTYRWGQERYPDLLKLAAKDTDDLTDLLPLPDVPSFPLTGQDLIDRGVQPGARLGDLLGELEDWWLKQNLEPERDACLRELDRRLQRRP